MDENLVLKVEKLNKKYKSGKGIFDIGFEVPKGAIVGIVGANGSGKSTLLSCIIGVKEKDNGKIAFKIDGKEYDEKNRKILNELGIVRCEQGFPEDFTAKTVSSIMKNVYRNWEQKKFAYILKACELDSGIKIQDYSTGMKSKLSIAVALSHNPKILVLDEATNGMDVMTCGFIKKLFFFFFEDGEHSIIFTSHKIGEVEKMADQIILMQTGRIIIDCSKDDMLQNYTVFQMLEGKFEKIDKNDVLKAYKEGFYINVLPKDARGFRKKYKVDKEITDLETIVEIMMRGEQ